MTALYALWQITAFALGAVFGSFSALAVYRVPKGLSVISPPSACPTCHHRLGPTELVPIFSWLVLRARCRHCHRAIAPSYALIELTAGLTGWLLFRRVIPTPESLDLASFAAFFIWLLFAILLLIAALTDVRARIIPTFASVYAVPFGVLAHGLLSWLGWHDPLAIGWQAAVGGAALGGGVLALTSWLWRLVMRSEGLAWGDVRLMAMIGSFTGPLPGTWLILLLASLFGSLMGLATLAFKGRSGWMPFGPALALAAFLWVLDGASLTRAILPGLAGFLPPGP